MAASLRMTVFKNVSRKRINNCLDQLRSLLPFTTSLKRDMASLMEQTVEYINTIHTVLNEERPACLSKIYMIYQRKVEENEYFRKGHSRGNKRSSSSFIHNSAYGMLPPQSPQVCQGYCTQRYVQDQGMMEADGKRHCPGLAYEQSVMQQGMSTPTGTGMPTWQPQEHQHIMEPTFVNVNNNVINQYVPCGSDFRVAPLNSSHYIFGQSPLTAQYGILSKQSEQVSPYSCAKYIPADAKIGNGLPKPMVQYVSSSPGEVASGVQEADLTTKEQSGQGEEKNSIADGMISKGRKQTLFNITSLVYNNQEDRTEGNCSVMHMANQSTWPQQDYSAAAMSYNPFIQRQSDNPPHSLLAPMDMSVSPQPPDGSTSSSPRIMGISKILRMEKPRDIPDFSIGRDIGISLKSSSVSSMLNEVTGPPTTDYSSRSYGSTVLSLGKHINPIFGSAKWHSQPISLSSTPTTREQETVQATSEPNPNSATPDRVTSLYPNAASCPAKLMIDETDVHGTMKAESPENGSTCQASPYVDCQAANSPPEINIKVNTPSPQEVIDCNNNLGPEKSSP